MKRRDTYTAEEFRTLASSGKIGLGSEHDDQVALFRWAAIQRRVYPELALLFAIPNGGLRDERVAARMKAEGARPGVPDVCLPVPRDGYGALFIELKHGKNRPTPEQQHWIEALRDAGNAVYVCRGLDEAVHTITSYLRGSRIE